LLHNLKADSWHCGHIMYFSNN